MAGYAHSGGSVIRVLYIKTFSLKVEMSRDIIIPWTESNLCTGAQHQYGQTYSKEPPKWPRNDGNSIHTSLSLQTIHEAF